MKNLLKYGVVLASVCFVLVASASQDEWLHAGAETDGHHQSEDYACTECKFLAHNDAYQACGAYHGWIPNDGEFAKGVTCWCSNLWHENSPKTYTCNCARSFTCRHN